MIMINLLLFKNFTARLAQTNLASKSDIDNFVKRTDFYGKLKQKLNKNVTSNKTKHVLLEYELNELSEKLKSNINERINKRFDKQI